MCGPSISSSSLPAFVSLTGLLYCASLPGMIEKGREGKREREREREVCVGAGR